MAERFERLFQLPRNLHSSGSPVILLAGSLLKDTQSKKVLVQLKFKNISAHQVNALKVQIATFDAAGEKIHGMKEYQYLDLAVSSGGVFGSNKAIILPNAETRSFQIVSLSIVLDNSICSVNMPLRALPDAELLERILKHPELIKQFYLEINEKAIFAPQEIQDTWRCSCGEWNGSENCSNCGVNREYLFSIYDPSILISKTTVRLKKEKAEQEELERQKRKTVEEEAQKAIIKNNNLDYIYCEQCGTKIKKGVKFCRYCGAKNTDSHAPDEISEYKKKQVANPIASTKQKKKSGVKCFVLIMALVPFYFALAYAAFTLTTILLENNSADNQGIVTKETTVIFESSDNTIIPTETTTFVNVSEVVDEIIDTAPSSVVNAKSKLNQYHNIMDRHQVQECLLEIGRWQSFNIAENYIRSYLKNPRSYYRYSGKCGTPSAQDDGTYKVTLLIDYGADNSFGASIRDEATIYVYFKINLATLEIDYTKTELDAYSKWKMVS